MTRFDRIRLRNGLGWVHPADGTVAAPPDGDSFLLAPGSREGAICFHAVDTPRPVAVLPVDPAHAAADDGELAAMLSGAGFAAVVRLLGDAPGAAVAWVYLTGAATSDDAAAALWALEVLGGWDESPQLALLITVDGAPAVSRWMTVRAAARDAGWDVDVESMRPGAWHALASDIAGLDDAAAWTVVLADVVQTLVYCDAYGHVAGDLMLARVHGCIEDLAIRRGAGFVRVGGDDFALLVRGGLAVATALARDLEQAVEGLAIPLAHPQLATAGRVTVRTAVASAHAGDPRAVLEAGIDRRRVAAAGGPVRGS